MLNLSRQLTDLQASQEKSNARVQQMKRTLKELEQGMTFVVQYHSATTKLTAMTV